VLGQESCSKTARTLQQQRSVGSRQLGEERQDRPPELDNMARKAGTIQPGLVNRDRTAGQNSQDGTSRTDTSRIGQARQDS
jgi:hypothetical protein